MTQEVIMADTTATVTPSTDGAQEAPSQDTLTQDASTATETSTPETTDDGADSSTAESPDTQEDSTDADDGDSTETPESQDDDPETDPTDDDADDDPAEDTQDTEKLQRSLRKTRREASNLRARLKTAETEALRYKTAMAAGIPEDAMEFLHGDTQEALEASAEKLLVMMGYHGRVTPPGGPVENGGNPRRGDFTTVDQARQTTDLDTIGSRIYEH